MTQTKQNKLNLPTLNSKAYGKNGFKYQPKFGVIIQCESEQHQIQVFEHLKQLGYKIKVVVV